MRATNISPIDQRLPALLAEQLLSGQTLAKEQLVETSAGVETPKQIEQVPRSPAFEVRASALRTRERHRRIELLNHVGDSTVTNRVIQDLVLEM